MKIFKISVSTKKLLGNTKRFLEARKLFPFYYKKWYMQVIEMAAAKLIGHFGFHQCSRFSRSLPTSTY